MTDNENQKQKALDFLNLHHSSSLFILPNAWDVASAKIFEVEAFKAIGTTSAGIAAVLGYADGQKMSLAENMDIVRRIVKNTFLPVSADVEAGYAVSPEGIAVTARKVIDTGAVGLNLEDSTGDARIPLYDQFLQQEKIKAIRETSRANGIHLVINARTDSFMLNEKPSEGLREAIIRGNAYKEAGADCIFVPDVGNLDKKSIEILVKEINAPVNIIAGSSSPSIQELQNLGVSRVSVGPRPMRAVLGFLRKIAKELSTEGTYKLMTESSLSYSEVNNWFNK